jgi:hypothetical protein
MAVTVEDFVSYANVSDDAIAESAFNVAEVMVDEKLVQAYREVPELVRDRIVLEVAHTLYKRKDSPSGSSQGVDFSSGQPVMGPRDPFAQVWPIIRSYVTPF